MKSFMQFSRTSRRAWRVVIPVLAALLGVAALLLATAQPARATPGLSVRIIAAPNLIVDSNVLSPSTAQPIVATVIGEFCNTGVPGEAALTNVVGHIGNYTAGTPGIYPVRSNPTESGGGVSTSYTGDYSFTHLGGAADATRLVGDIPAGECRYQYWSFTYPKTATSGASTIPAWGNSVKPGDDLWLTFDIWGTADGSYAANTTHTMTMRNEISAMANKIKPNGNPSGRWFNTDTDVVYPGDIVTTNGILYRIGNVNFGFDNDNDGFPDYNAWVQPFGDPSYDPSCFRLISTHGTLTVTRSSGADLIIPFEDNLYFTNLPPDNTDVRGEVYYTFLALGGACTVPISPYQEAASGFDNEKFNGDYGTGVPGLKSYEPEVILDKTGNESVAEPGTITYEMPFYNNSADASAGLTLSSGGLVDMPLTIQDTIPDGLSYVCGSANVINRTPADLGFEIQYSKDSGATWGTEIATWAACATAGTYVGPDTGESIILRFVLTEPLPKKSGTPAPGGTATFQARVPANFVSGGGDPFIENCAEARFGYDTPPFAEACTITMVQGTGSIGDRVWLDQNGNGIQDTGELGISGVTVWLYWDRNNNNFLDDNDVLVDEAVTSGTGTSNYDFTSLPAGEYIVVVDSTDADLSGNTTPTTVEFYAVTLASGQDYNTADFGFAPSLRLDKYLDSPDPAVVGETVTFKIDLRNTLPGDGTPNGYCTYYVWPTVAATDSVSGKQFTFPDNAMGAPNFTYATADFNTGASKWMSGATFSSGGRSSGITRVEAIFDIYLTEYLIDDYLTISMSGGAAAWTHDFTTGETNAYAAGEGAKGYLSYIIPGANAPVGAASGWDWADFDVSALTLRIDVNKIGASEKVAYLYLDAMGFRVTTDDTSCANGNTTINPLPLDDTYDTSYLEFVSADPPPSSTGTGTLHWDNLGPLYAGGVRTVTVNFLATATATDATNTASVTEATFTNGRDTNDPSDSATVDINASGSISGHVFADSGSPGTWVSPNGYGTGDTFFPGTTVQLYGCFSTVTDRILTAATAPSTNKECTYSNNNGEWRLIETAYTDINGAYSFTGLRDGYYNVVVVTATLPPGFVSSVETTPAANGAGGGAGDSQWNVAATANLDTFNDLVNGTTGENVTAVSFGYRDDTASPNTQGGLYGYVWNDKDGDGIWDAGEEPIPGVTVYVCDSTDTAPCTSSNANATATTDANGRFIFGNLAPGSYFTQVDTSDLPGMSQSGDPDYPTGTCGGLNPPCDNRNTTLVTVTANVISDAGDFGYTGGLSIGDTVYVDWNGDGDKDGSSEEGIPGVTVYLYRDLDGDGVIDPGDTLLATDVTDASGVYGFSGLAGNGNKYLVVVDSNDIPTGYLQTADPDATKDHQNVVTLNDASIDTIDFGYQPRGFGSVGDFVWFDVDADGIQDSSEAGVPNVTLNIYEDFDGDGVLDTEDAFIASTVTLNYNVIGGAIDISGNGSIGDEDDLGGNGLYGHLIYNGLIDLTGDGSVTSADDGNLGPYAVINGYLDMDGSGTITTDDDTSLKGFYLFKNLPLFNNLPADDFIIRVAPAEFTTGGDLVGYSLTNTATPYNASQISYELTLAANQTFYEVDFGFAQTAIGDFVWIDANANGMHDPGEVGLNGVTLNLYIDANNNGVLDASESTTPYRTTTTANNSNGQPGYYLFNGIPVGNYVVEVEVPSGYALSGDPDAYNDSDPLDFSCLNADGSADTNMVGCDGFKFMDRWDSSDENDLAPALSAGQRDLSADFGMRPSLGIIGDTVWIDADGDGLFDSNETGIREVTVWLYEDEDGDGVIDPEDDLLATKTTNEYGYYAFSGVADGDYIVKVDTTDIPTGLSQSYDPDETGICTTCDSTGSVTMSGGVTILTQDFGYRFQGNNTLVGTVWHDTDSGGQTGGTGDIDGTETYRYSQVPVYLWSCGADATCGTSDDVYIGTTLTDSSGNYTFPNLANGTYRVAVNGNDTTLSELTKTTTTSYDGTPGTDPAVVFSTGNETARRDFGLLSPYDYGDLPASYNITLFRSAGPRHLVLTGGPRLGSLVDTEPNGQEADAANGDDNDGSNDDDGVARTSGISWSADTDGSLTINVSNCAATCYLSGWVDWGRDGSFQSGDRVLLDLAVTNGSRTVTIDVPTGTIIANNTFFARFRLYSTSTYGAAQPTGYASSGEVEDYRWPFGPTAVEMISLEARANPSGLPIWAWLSMAALVSAGGLITLRLVRKQR